MANKILFQNAPIADNNPVTAATVPAGLEWIVSLISVTNLSEEAYNDTPSSVRYKIHIVKAGDGPTVKNCLAYYPLYGHGESIHEYKDIKMAAGDMVVIYNKSGRIAVQGFGDELPLGREVVSHTDLQAIAANILLIP